MHVSCYCYTGGCGHTFGWLSAKSCSERAGSDIPSSELCQAESTLASATSRANLTRAEATAMVHGTHPIADTVGGYNSTSKGVYLHACDTCQEPVKGIMLRCVHCSCSTFCVACQSNALGSPLHAGHVFQVIYPPNADTATTTKLQQRPAPYAPAF